MNTEIQAPGLTPIQTRDLSLSSPDLSLISYFSSDILRTNKYLMKAEALSKMKA